MATPDDDYNAYMLWTELNACPACDGVGEDWDEEWTCETCGGTGIDPNAVYEGPPPI